MREAILVTDGEQRAALAVVRSLGRAGYRPIVASAVARPLAGTSRWAAASVLTPDPLRDPAGAVAAWAEAVRRWDARLVLPVTEASTLAALARSAQLEPARVPPPDLETFRRVADKAAVLAEGAAVGIAAPRQVQLEVPPPPGIGALAGVRFPLVLKPSRSVAGEGSRRAKFSVTHAATAAELERRIEGYPMEAFPLLVQERVVGPGIGVFLLRWEGTIRARFSHRRLREKPPSGGVSVYRESYLPPPELIARSEALLERLGWEGVAMIEYKVDSATGTPRLMEINGRFWGSLQLAVDAGVDFPRMLADLALGRDPGPPPAWRAGVRSRWWWGDVDQLLARLRRSRAELALPPDAPGRLRALLQFLRVWWPGDRAEVCRLGDPRPFLRETLDWLRGR